MDSYIPNLKSADDKYFSIKTPIEEYDEIVKNILTIQFENFVKHKREL